MNKSSPARRRIAGASKIEGNPRPQPAPFAPSGDGAAREWRGAELFSGAREARIWHNGECYTLRQTRLGKLILTK